MGKQREPINHLLTRRPTWA